MIIRSRREFIRNTVRTVGALGATGMLAKFGQVNAFAAPLSSPPPALHMVAARGIRKAPARRTAVRHHAHSRAHRHSAARKTRRATKIA